MSAARTTRRAAIPPSLSPHPKPTITMEEWESKAPLGDLSKRTVAALKSASEKPVTVPLNFPSDESTSSRPNTPQPKHKLLPASRASTPRIPSPRAHAHALHPRQPVQTPQQFYDWFALIDRSVAHSQEAHFREHLLSVSEHLEVCDALLERVEEVEGEVEGMLEGWRSVDEGGKSLQEACQKLLEERDRLLALQETIGTRLEYFHELEHATRMLNHPGESLVLQTDFLYMVERVDVCIDFLKSHRHFKEAEVYLLRFEQCLTRAMTLIRMFFVGSLRALTQDVSRRLAEKDVSQTAQTHLLYTRFTSVSAQLAPLLGELERRARAHPDTLGALLAECHTAYFSARKTLLVGRLTEEIRGLDPTRTELVELTRAGCSYLKQLCTDEFNVYRAFFHSGKDRLYQYLENLCDYLYDDLRPRILHEPRLTALCEVCTVLQALMVLDVPALSSSSSSSSPSSSSSDSDEEDELTTDPGASKRKRQSLGPLHIGQLLQMVLQDAQTRLFFKAQSVIQSEIRYYVPKPEDLAYPDKLVETRKPGGGHEIREKESTSGLFRSSSPAREETWYPTLSKTLWVLSQLHDFVQPAIFTELAQESLALCLRSLASASESLAATKSPLDAHLFLVRHLLILKDATRNLDLVGKEDARVGGGGGVTDTLSAMLTRTTSVLPSSLVESLGMSRGAADEMADAKHNIDAELKRACEALIASITEPIIAPLHAFASHTQATSASPPISEALALSTTFRTALGRDLGASVARLRLYLEDKRTVDVLLGHVRERIEGAYAGFRDVVGGLEGGLSEEGLREVLRSVFEEGGGG